MAPFACNTLACFAPRETNGVITTVCWFLLYMFLWLLLFIYIALFLGLFNCVIEFNRYMSYNIQHRIKASVQHLHFSPCQIVVGVCIVHIQLVLHWIEPAFLSSIHRMS